MAQYDAIVVGGGHNGLVAAGYLAQAGLKPLVLERREAVGGPTSVVEYFPGYNASIANSPGSLEPKIVRELNLHEHGLRFVKPNPSLVYPFPQGRGFIGWREPQRNYEQLAQFSRADADNYPRFFAYIEEFARLLNINLFAPPPSFADIVSRIRDPRSEEMFARIMFGSTEDILDDWFESDEVKAIIGSLMTVANLAGPKTPGALIRALMRPLSLASSDGQAAEHDPRKQTLRGSTGLPIGGMGAIPNAMASSLRAAGGEIRTGADVVEVIVVDGVAQGVALTSGEEIYAPIVLSNLNPKTTFQHLVSPSHLDTEFNRQIRQLRMRGTAFKLGLALDRLPVFDMATSAAEAEVLAGCQFRIAPSLDYMEKAYDDAKYGRTSQGPMLWGLIPSVADPQLAPEGRHLMSVNVFHAPYELADSSWDTEREVFGQRCIDVLEDYFPGLKESILEVRYWSPVDLEAEFGLIGAQIAHGETLPQSMFSFRPVAGWSEYATPISGLYLCGSGAWPGGSVSGVPGHNAAMRVLGDARRGSVNGTSRVLMGK